MSNSAFAPPETLLPPPTPPPPRKSRTGLILGVVAIVTVGAIAVTAVATRGDDPEPTAAAAADEAAPVAETPPAHRSSTTESGLPDWADTDGQAFMLDAQQIIEDSTDLIGDMQTATEDYDLDEVASLALDAYRLWSTAPDAPPDVPIADEWSELRTAAMDAFRLTAEAFTTLDPDTVDEAAGKLSVMTGRMSELNDAVLDAAAEL